MNSMAVAKRWDAALRASDWMTARSLLTDDAQYHTPEAVDPDAKIDCETADEIVDLMARFKGQMPDIEVIEWSEKGDHVVARLRQPAWGTDSDWYQVLTISGDRVSRLTDYATRGSALEAISESGDG